jgi:hypothetical protein
MAPGVAKPADQHNGDDDDDGFILSLEEKSINLLW